MVPCTASRKWDSSWSTNPAIRLACQLQRTRHLFGTAPPRQAGAAQGRTGKPTRYVGASRRLRSRLDLALGLIQEQMTKPKRKGLLLGAGFSSDLGMPLVAEVTEIILSMFDARSVRHLGTLLLKNKPYSKERPISEPAIREGLSLLLDYKEQNKTNYEELLASLENHPAKTQSDRDSFHYLFEFLYELIYVVLVAYQRHSYEVLYPLNRPWFAKFEDLLSAEETWIFSLNHDLYVECLAIDFGIPVTYGDTNHVRLPISNIVPSDQIHLTCLSRESLSGDTAKWMKGCRGINLVRLHGGFAELQYKDNSLICNPSLEWQ
jgi:hypothetical protein